MTTDDPIAPAQAVFTELPPPQGGDNMPPIMQASAPEVSTELPPPREDYTALRARLVAEFEQWLDQTLSDEPPPRGLPESLLTQAMAEVSPEQTDRQTGQETDLYTLFSSLTGLTGEIRLQGRAFKQLSDLLSPVAQLPALLVQLHEAQSESAHLIQAVAEQTRPDAPDVDFKRVFDVMIDFYDRLQRGLQTCDEGIRSLQARQRDSWLRRLVGATEDSDQAALGVQAIADAVALTLARLESVLQEWGVARIGKVGEPFDPDRMTAMEVRADPKIPSGIVLAVQRSGYALNGVLKATAQVTVSKAIN